MFRLDSQINFGNILTSVSILFAVATFLYAETQKRAQVDRAYAAEVRNELGSVLREVAQMDTELQLLFLTVEPLYVTASEIALDSDAAGRQRSAQKARDFLWREISDARAEMERRVLEKSAQSNGLAIAGAALQSEYEDFVQRHADIRFDAFSELSAGTQAAINNSAQAAEYSAQIGNALRAAHYAVEQSARAASAEARQEISARIHAAASDYQIR